jgi:outer membrane protein TolC
MGFRQIIIKLVTQTINLKVKMGKRSNLLVLFLLFWSALHAQTDTTLLGIDDFLSVVKRNHPLVKQADVILKAADANQLAARGNFDPQFYYEFRNKFYGDQNYYQLGNGGFKVPTWYGIELKGGLEQNNGQFLNPENKVPENGLWYAQISVPLLQGLVIDERRAILKQATLFKGLSFFDQINTINEILYKAGKTYWDWHLAYTNMLVLQNAVAISSERFEAIKRSALFGDRPFIDTVEAIIQLQDRLVNAQQAVLDYQTKSLLLSNFLWAENNTPIELSDKTVPLPYSSTYSGAAALFNNVSSMDSLVNNHPSLKVYDFKLQQLSIEQRLKREKLKPKLNINYNPFFQSSDNPTYFNNYKFGVTVGMSLLLRKERGELQLTKAKIGTLVFETTNKRNELLNKIKASVNEFGNYGRQIDIFTLNVGNYRNLWQSEKKLFDSGESSLFMINQRELSYINAQIKLNELVNKHKKAALDAENAFGQLYKIY